MKKGTEHSMNLYITKTTNDENNDLAKSDNLVANPIVELL
jgi:hypothetical protein